MIESALAREGHEKDIDNIYNLIKTRLMTDLSFREDRLPVTL